METHYKLMKVWEAKPFPDADVIDEKERRRRLESISQLSRTAFPPNTCNEQVPMPLHEEIIVVIMWLLFFGVMLYGPFVLILIGMFRLDIALTLVVISLTIGLTPTPFKKWMCDHYLATLNLKYFSYRGVWRTTIPPNKRFIVITPPHGLFPFGGILGILAIPRFAGFFPRGLAASVILRIPFVGNLLQFMGVIDAAKANVIEHLQHDEVIGISSGGIAEIFETNAAEGTECILLKSRGGICKLALETGTDLIPAYLFGNSKAIDVWYDSYGIMQWLSRKLRVSLVFFTGRWGLPVPYRTPLLGVCGDPIAVPHIPNPSPEQVQELLNVLQVKIKELFDTHKASFGWKHVELTIK